MATVAMALVTKIRVLLLVQKKILVKKRVRIEEGGVGCQCWGGHVTSSKDPGLKLL